MVSINIDWKNINSIISNNSRYYSDNFDRTEQNKKNPTKKDQAEPQGIACSESTGIIILSIKVDRSTVINNKENMIQIDAQRGNHAVDGCRL